MVRVGDAVTFVDSIGQDRPALVTAVWGISEENLEWIRQNKEEEVYQESLKYCETPSINVVIISDDAKRDDPYGRQIERHTSVVHKSNQYAHGNYWK